MTQIKTKVTVHGILDNGVGQELGKALYEEAAKKTAGGAGKAGPSKQPPPQPPEGEVRRKPGGDDVIDAEFEAKDK